MSRGIGGPTRNEAACSRIRPSRSKARLKRDGAARMAQIAASSSMKAVAGMRTEHTNRAADAVEVAKRDASGIGREHLPIG